MNGAWAAPTALVVGVAAAAAVVLIAIVARRVAVRSGTSGSLGSDLGAAGPGGLWRVLDGRLVGVAGRRGDPLEPAEGIGLGGIVAPGNSALVATLAQGSFARLIAPGGTFRLAPDERPHSAVSVDPIELTGAVEGALTRDAVPVRRVEWRAVVQLRVREGASPLPGDPYPFDPHAARQAAFGPSNLSEAARIEVDDALSEAIRTFAMHDLIDSSAESPPMQAAIELARLALAESIAPWGLGVTSVRVRRLTLDADVQEHLTAVWHARAERQVRAVRSEAEEPLVAKVPADSGSRSPVRAADIPPTTRSRRYSRDEPTQVPAPTPAPVATPATVAGPAAEGASAPGRKAKPPPQVTANPLLPGYDDVSPETIAGLRAAAAAVRAARSVGTAPPATPNPVSFSTFLGSLREKARNGDDVAESVLRQVLDVMARIDSGASSPRVDPRTADHAASREPALEFVQGGLDIE